MQKCPICKTTVQIREDAKATLRCSECGAVLSGPADKRKPVVRADKLGRGSEGKQQKKSHGQYDFIKQLGQGSFGTVWKARDTRLNRIVALKIPKHSGGGRDRHAKFFREARAVAQLNHPGIVRVFEVGQWGDQPYIATEFINGSDLRVFLAENKIEVDETVQLIEAMSNAIHAAHQAGIVHRDLKPANVMIDAEHQPHVMDFGLAKDIVNRNTTTTVAGMVMGTPAYMSPEQARGDSNLVDARSDIYSLGVVLFEMLTGELPFRGRSIALLHQVIHDDPPEPRRLNTTIPIDLQNICLKCLQKQPDQRYQSAAAFSTELRAFREHRPVTARPLTRIQRTRKWCYRNPTVASLLGLTAACLVAVCIVSVAFLLRERRHRRSLQAALVRETDATDFAEKISTDLRIQNERLVAAQQLSTSVLQQRVNFENSLVVPIASLFTHEFSQFLRQGRLYDCQELYAKYRQGYGPVFRKTWAASYLKKTLDLHAIWPTHLNRHVEQVWIVGEGKILIAHDDAGRLWRVNLSAQTPKIQALSLENVGAVRAVAISEHGPSHVVLSEEPAIHFFDKRWVKRGKVEGIGEGKLLQLALNDSGNRLAVINDQASVTIYDMETREELSRSQCEIAGQEAVRLSWAPDGSAIAVLASQSIHFFNSDSGAPLSRATLPSPVVDSDWLHDSSAMVVCGKWGLSEVSCADGKTQYTQSSLPDLVSIRTDPQGRVCALSRSGYFNRTDLRSGQHEQWLQIFDRSGQCLVGPLVDGRIIAVDDAGNVCKVSPDAPAFAPPEIVRHHAAIRRITWSPNDRYLAATDWSGKCIIWDGSTLSRHHELITSLSGEVCESAEWCPDGKSLATCNRDGTMQLWAVDSGTKIHEFEPTGQPLFCLSWHPTQNLIASGGPDGMVRLWEPGLKRPLQLWSAGKVVEQVQWSRDGKTLAVVGDDFHLCKREDARLTQVMKRSMPTRVFDVAQSAFADTWTLVDSSGDAYLYKPGKSTKRFRIANRELRSVRFSRDDVSLVTLDIEGTIQFSDYILQRENFRLNPPKNRGSNQRGWHIDFSHDGTRLAACSANGEIRIWDIRQTSP